MNVLKAESLHLISSSNTLQEQKKSLSLKTPQDIPMQIFKISEAGHLRGLSIVNEDVVWASGTNGSIIRTEDSGKNWSVYHLSDVKGLDFRAVHAFNSQQACIMSAGLAQDNLARIYRTNDGGKSWKLVFSTDTPNIFLNAMSFWDEKNGIVLGDPIDKEFVLFKTDDGGQTWKRLVPDVLPPALSNEAVFAASNSCLTVQGTQHVWFATGRTSSARVFYSSDRGCNWQVAETPLQPYNGSSGIFSLAFRNDQEGIAVGGDYNSPSHFSGANILTTNDGGRHWHSQDCQHLTGFYLSSVTWTSEAEAMIVEGNSKFLNSISFKDGHLWGVGPEGVCAHYSI